MKTIISITNRQVLLATTFFVVFALMTMISSCKKSAEKTSEKLIETTIGDNANVDIDDEKITIKTDEGTFTSDATIKSWPKTIPDDVPEFKDGKIVNVSTQFVDEAKNWTLLFEDISDNSLDDYEAELKKNGFKVSTITMGETKSHITAQKDDFIVIVMGGEGMASLSVAIDQ
ncbi:hypothetical protein [Psychroserpens sp.]|uniref:hypothetical protein n=1 Tax=Psychroserpens sp. TaxID=2020870 RepID=UPI002B271720|nr:hypothetical protein [Psychroserpens sp.]